MTAPIEADLNAGIVQSLNACGLPYFDDGRCRFALSTMLTAEVRYRLLTLLGPSPDLSQREVARKLGISLGRANYCLKALMDKGWIKAASFRNGRNKVAYMYLLTPSGIEAKARVTREFLKIKLREYETLKQEIERIRREVKMEE